MIFAGNIVEITMGGLLVTYIGADGGSSDVSS